MSIVKVIKRVAIIISISISPLSNAAVISQDFNLLGDDFITLDTVTGLEWLDLTVTNNYSRDQILDKLEAGARFEGWRYASSDEVISLWSNFFIDLTPTGIRLTAGLGINVDYASDMLGNTRCEYDCITYPYGALGMTSDTFMTDLGLAASIMGVEYTIGDYTYYLTEGSDSRLTDQSATYFGHYLVRPLVVPLPTTSLLFISGLFGLFITGKQRKITC